MQIAITLDYAYLSQIYGVLGKLKIRRGQLHEGSIPSPGTIESIIDQVDASSDEIRVEADRLTVLPEEHQSEIEAD